MRTRKFWMVLLIVGLCFALWTPAFGQDAQPTTTKDQIDRRVAELKSNRSDVRVAAADALGNMGSSAASAVPALIEFLKNKESDVRRSAAYALGKIGSSAATTVLALITILKDTDSFVGFEARDALGRIAASLEMRVRGMESAELTDTLTLWQNAQSHLDSMNSKDAPLFVDFEKAQSAVHHLVEALEQEKQNR